MTLNPQQVTELICQLSQGKPLWLAYSGGVDSHVLLHIISQSATHQLRQLKVIHIDHGLNPASQQWTQHCAQVSARYGFEFHSLQVNVDQVEQMGIEAAARQARYQGMAQIVPDDAVLLTAQHQQDQAETLLLQLLRGAGPKGLAAMAVFGEIEGMTVLRPLLDTDKHAILAYAHEHGLQWIDDPSNSDTQINRNYLRHQLWPLLEQRWPGVAQTLSRSARHCAETVELTDVLAQQDLLQLNADIASGEIEIPALLQLSLARQRNAIRYLLQQMSLPLPSTVALERILDEVCTAASDKTPLVHWQGAEVRRFQNHLFFMQPLPAAATDFSYHITSPQPLHLADGRILEWCQSDQGNGIPASWFASGLTLRFRQGGERIRLIGCQHHNQLKQLMQQWQVPPWQRDRTPLLYKDDQLIAVVGYGLAEECMASDEEQHWLPQITATMNTDFN